MLFITHKEAIGARQAAPTALHSVHPFVTTDSVFQKAEFDKVRDSSVTTLSPHIFLLFEEKEP